MEVEERGGGAAAARTTVETGPEPFDGVLYTFGKLGIESLFSSKISELSDFEPNMDDAQCIDLLRSLAAC